MAEIITIMNRFPHDISLSVGGTTKKRVLLNGAKRSLFYHPMENKMLGSVGITQIDKTFWEEWLNAHKGSPLVASQMIFSSKNETEGKAKFKDFENAETGYQGIKQDNPSRGIEKADFT